MILWLKAVCTHNVNVHMIKLIRYGLFNQVYFVTTLLSNVYSLNNILLQPNNLIIVMAIIKEYINTHLHTIDRNTFSFKSKNWSKLHNFLLYYLY